MGKSKKPKPDPKSANPATTATTTSSPKIIAEEPPSPPENPSAKSSPPPNEEDFESYYIKRVTAEFADDIDRLRSAPDFSEQSVPVLIQALKQGAKGFGEEERQKVMKGR